jgi:hypothetical protein
MQFVTTFPLSGNGTDFREFGYTGSSDDIRLLHSSDNLRIGSPSQYDIKKLIKFHFMNKV